MHNFLEAVPNACISVEHSVKYKLHIALVTRLSSGKYNNNKNSGATNKKKNSKKNRMKRNHLSHPCTAIV